MGGWRGLLVLAVVALASAAAGYVASRYHVVGALKARAELMLHGDCGVPMVGEICPAGSRQVGRPYEEAILEGLPPVRAATEVAAIGDAVDYVKRAVGWDRIPAVTIDCRPYQEPVQACSARYGDLLTARFLFRDGDPAKPLLVMLHGHVTGADKVMGLQPEDYMRRAGAVLADEGYAVAAPDLTYSADTSARLHGQLTLRGMHLYGLWSRLACDIARHFAERDVIIYGLSNGGEIASHTAVLCDAPNIRLVWVEDILTDWRALFDRHESIHARQNYGLYYLAPLRHEASYLSFMLWSRYPKVYTSDGPPASLPAACLGTSAVGQARAVLAPLVVPHHVVQLELLREYLATGSLATARGIDLDCVERSLHRQPS